MTPSSPTEPPAMVPREPSEEHFQAAMDAVNPIGCCAMDLSDARAFHRAMLAASPDVGASTLPDIGPDPMQTDDGREGWEERLKQAYVVQQKGVPNQCALVWRWDLGQMRSNLLRYRAMAKRSDVGARPIAAEGRDEIARICYVGGENAWTASDPFAFAERNPLSPTARYVSEAYKRTDRILAALPTPQTEPTIPAGMAARDV